MKKIIALFLAIALSGCANLQNAISKLESVQVTPQQVSIAGNTFDALERIGEKYIRLPRCTGSNGPACRDPAATKKVISAIRSGRVARANLEQFFSDHPDQLGPAGLYDALQKAIATINGINTQAPQ